MSILNVDEIRDETGSTTIAPSIPGLDQRFAQAHGAISITPTVINGFNVSSVVDSGVGIVTVNFINVVSNNAPIASAVTTLDINASVGFVGTSGFNVHLRTANTGAAIDRAFNFVSFGD